MIDKALGPLFKAISEEASANKAFGVKLENALAKFAEEFVEARKAEAAVGAFHPFIAFKEGTPEEFRARLGRFSAVELRLIVKDHHLDPAGSLPAKAPKKALVEHIAAAAAKRAERDAKLFEY